MVVISVEFCVLSCPNGMSEFASNMEALRVRMMEISVEICVSSCPTGLSELVSNIDTFTARMGVHVDVEKSIEIASTNLGGDGGGRVLT